MSKLKQDERVYFKIAEGIEGYASVAGDYDLIVILKPEKPINNYSHIYVSKLQITERADAPVVPQEDVVPNGTEMFPSVQ